MKDHVEDHSGSACHRANGHHKSWFGRVAQRTAVYAGRPAAFLAAVLTIVAWIASGPLFGFSDTWQLVINTGTTIVTFLMVFLIQNSQNRETVALHLKMDEILRVTKTAQNRFMDLEDLDDAELEEIREHYRHLAEKARTLREEKRAAKHPS
ncbi:low affinity iron permease family protein [Planctomyces sp. SH-PL14]|uniref:low affinity iron permease family protein n=1 Tax=Planctomyces sp. SH-PL14 TaxID=1632864 RepID=UPI00078E63E7|nr:low affinity iron permease family protein [Planctomyces sp. SH-PL14]AMV20062.1 Low affinity iron permease [Planctomyces sp. SH-PL14]